MLLKTKQILALAMVATATLFLAACNGGGGSGGGTPPPPNCAGGTCINGSRIPGRIGGLAAGTYIRGFATDGKVQLGINNAVAMAALCQQSMDSGRGAVETSNTGVTYQGDEYYAGNPNYTNSYQGYGLCTTLAQTVLTFHYDQNNNVLRWRFYFNGVGSQIFQGQLQRRSDGTFQAVSGGLVFTGLDTGAQLNVTLSAYNQANAPIASGTMTPSAN